MRKLVFVTESDEKQQAPAEPTPAPTLKVILAGLAPKPVDRREQVIRFKMLERVKGLTIIRQAELCGISEATCKRWRKGGYVDKRDALPLTKKAPGVDPKSSLDDPLSTNLTGFDAVHDLKRISRTKGVPIHVRVSALRIVAAHENQHGRIPWESIKVADIPEEVRHRLAGLLLQQVAWDELPEEVRAASPVRRRVYRLLGVLPADDALAEAVLARHRGIVAELRAELEPEAAAVEREPLRVSLAVEAGRKAR